MVSVVIPVKNQCECLKETLSLLKKQIDHAYSEEERDLIVVDDCSSDETLDYLFAHFPDIRVLSNESERGLARSINRGIAMAKHTHVLVTFPTVLQKELPKIETKDICVTPRLKKEKLEAILKWGYVITKVECLSKSQKTLSSPFIESFVISKAAWDDSDGLDPFFDSFQMTHHALGLKLKQLGHHVRIDDNWNVEDTEKYTESVALNERGKMGLIWRTNTKGYIKVASACLIVIAIFTFNIKLLRAFVYTAYKTLGEY